MKRWLAPLAAGLTLAGCVTLDDWSEAPGSDRYGYDHPAPVGWWGHDATSIDLFYGPLAGYGHWSSHPRYGRVFWPGVGPGWQPYTRGYWRDDGRYGRRWISSEPFGWATYHYGRWGQDPRLGWYWVPDTRFGNSWVDWRSDGWWSPQPPRGYGGRNPWIGKPYPNRPDRPDRPDQAGNPRPGGQAGNPRPPFRIPPNSHPRSEPEWQGGERQPGGEGYQGGERQPRREGWQQGRRPGYNRQPPQDARREGQQAGNTPRPSPQRPAGQRPAETRPQPPRSGEQAVPRAIQALIPRAAPAQPAPSRPYASRPAPPREAVRQPESGSTADDR